MVFQKTVTESGYGFTTVMVMFTHSRVGIATDSLNKPWTEEQKQQVRFTTQLVVKSSSTISCQRVYHARKEPSNANLTQKASQPMHFLPLGGDIKEAINKQALNPPFKKKNLGNMHR